jgi:steroid delta-isomerase-like uncharacterized protein
MTASHHLAEAFAQTLTDHDLAAFADLLHADHINHNRYAQPGKEGSVGIFAGFLSAFEDFRVEIDDVIDAGHTVVGRYTYRGRHTGTFMRVPPSGTQIEMHSIDIWRIRDGRLYEHWDELNNLEFFQQICALPTLT